MCARVAVALIISLGYNATAYACEEDAWRAASQACSNSSSYKKCATRVYVEYLLASEGYSLPQATKAFNRCNPKGWYYDGTYPPQ